MMEETSLRLGIDVDPLPTGEWPETPRAVREWLRAPKLARSEYWQEVQWLADRVGAAPAVTYLADRLSKRFRRLGMPIAARYLVVDPVQATVLGLDSLTDPDCPFARGEGLWLEHGMLRNDQIPEPCWRYIGEAVIDTASRLGVGLQRWRPHPGAFVLALPVRRAKRKSSPLLTPRRGSPPGEKDALWAFYSGGEWVAPREE